MKGNKNNTMTPLLLLLGVLAVLVPASIFYYFHVTHQANYYRERSFRALTEVSQMINLRLTGLENLARLAPANKTGIPVDQLRSRRIKITREIENLGTESIVLENEIDAAAKTLSGLIQKLKYVREEKERNNSKRQDIETKITSAYETYDLEIQDLEMSIRRAGSAYNETLSELSARERNLDNIKQTLAGLESSIKNLISNQEAAGDEIDSLRSQIQAVDESDVLDFRDLLLQVNDVTTTLASILETDVNLNSFLKNVRTVVQDFSKTIQNSNADTLSRRKLQEENSYQQLQRILNKVSRKGDYQARCDSSLVDQPMTLEFQLNATQTCLLEIQRLVEVTPEWEKYSNFNRKVTEEELGFQERREQAFALGKIEIENSISTAKRSLEEAEQAIVAAKTKVDKLHDDLERILDTRDESHDSKFGEIEKLVNQDGKLIQEIRKNEADEQKILFQINTDEGALVDKNRNLDGLYQELEWKQTLKTEIDIIFLQLEKYKFGLDQNRYLTGISLEPKDVFPDLIDQCDAGVTTVLKVDVAKERRILSHSCNKDWVYSIPASSLWGDAWERTEFDHILIADASKKVILAIDTARSSDETDNGNHREAIDILGIRDASVLINQLLKTDTSDKSKTPDKAESIGGKVAHALMGEIEIAGQLTTVFVKPVQLTFPVVIGNKLNYDDWYVLGITKKSKSQSQVFSASLASIGLILMVLVLGVVSWPIVKLAFIGQREALGVGESFLVALSAVFALALVTLAILEMWSYQANRDEFDDLAEQISNEILQDFEWDLETLWNTVNEIDLSTNQNLQITSDLAIILPLGGKGAQDEGYNLPPFTVSFALADNGIQCGKQINYIQQSMAELKVSNRAYFKHANARDLWRWNSSEGPYPLGFYIERIINYSDGRKTTTVSMPYQTGPWSSAGDNCEPKVLVAGTRLSSLFSPVLPKGFKFAVVDNQSCLVLYHSNDRRSLVENFCDELDRDPDLMLAMDKGYKELRSGRYHGGYTRFLMRPLGQTLEEVPWTLVVFYDLNLLQTFHFNITLTSIGSIFVFILFLTVYFVLVQWMRPGHARRYASWPALWPQWNRSDVYVAIFMVMSVASLVLIALIYIISGGWLLTWVVLLHAMFCLAAFHFLTEKSPETKSTLETLKRTPATWIGAGLLLPVFVVGIDGERTVALLVWVGYAIPTVLIPYCRIRILEFSRGLTKRLGIQANKHGLVWNLPFRRLYLGTAVVFVFSLAILPAVSFFKDAHRIHADAFTKIGVLHVIEQLETQDRKRLEFTRVLFSDYYDSAVTDPLRFGPQYTGRGFYLFKDVVSGNSSGKYLKLVCKEEKGSPRCIYIEKLAFSNETYAEIVSKVSERGLGATIAIQFPAYSKLAGELLRGLRWLSSDDESGIQANNHLPMKTGLAGYVVELFLTFLILVISLYFFIHMVAKRMFGIGIPGDSHRVGFRAETPEIESGFYMYVRPGKDDWIAIRSITDLVEIDLSTEPYWSVARVENELGKGQRTVLVHNLESLAGDSKRREKALEVLETLCAASLQKHTVYLFVEISPLYRLIHPEQYPEIEKCEITNDETYRWSALLERFSKRYCWQPIDLTDQEVNEPLATLRSECSAFADLREFQDLYAAHCNPENPDVNREQVIEAVGTYAGALYRKQWTLSTMDERMQLFHVANRQHINTNNVETVEHLLRRGLLVRDPVLRIANESFARFVQSAEDAETFAEWQQIGPRSAWTVLKAPLLVILILIFTVFFTIAGEEFRMIITALTGSLAVLPILLKGISLIRSSSGTDMEV